MWTTTSTKTNHYGDGIDSPAWTACERLRNSVIAHTKFTEIGASGRWWDVQSIPTVTSAGSASSESPVKVSRISGTVLAPGIVHLTYFADDQGRQV